MSLSSVFLSNVFYSLVDDGVANLLGLETLRHGTNSISNALIRCTGGNPALGEASYGSGGSSACQQNFYLFKDSEYILEEPAR